MKKNTNMSERLSVFIDYTGLEVKDFGKKFMTTSPEISRWKNGQRISMNKLTDMLDAYPELNAHWLLTGEGSMLNNLDGNQVNDKQEEYCTDIDCLKIIDKLKSEKEKLTQDILELQQEKIAWLEKDKH